MQENNINEDEDYKNYSLHVLIKLWASKEKKIYGLVKLGYKKSDNPLKRFIYESNQLKKIIANRERETFYDAMEQTKQERYKEEQKDYLK